MRKEVIWAGAIGISFGLIVAFGIWRINASLKNTSKYNPNVTPTPLPINSELKITLDKPESGDVVTDSSVTITGITKTNTWVAISGESDDYITQSDSTGLFSQAVNLTPGVNQIKVSAIEPSGIQNVEKVLVVYSSVFKLNTVPTQTPSENSSDSAIRQKVAEKVAEALNKPKAYIGVVTDIADSTIQIKSTSSEIEQISTNDGDTAVMNTVGTNNNEVKLSDIAIGDFIVAMGYVNSNSVLSAQRILISDAVTERKITSDFAKVTNSENRPITVQNVKDGSEVDITPDYNTDIELYKDGKETPVRLSSINDGDQIIYVTDSSGKTAKIRAIFVVIQKPQGTPSP